MGSFTIPSIYYNSTIFDLRLVNGSIDSIVPANGNTDRYLIPGGFTELHFHGAAGYKTINLMRDAYCGISNFLARHGVTSFLAAFSAAPFGVMVEYVDFVRTIMREGLPGARLAGIYLEGPCFKNAGAMNPELLRIPTESELKKLLKTGNEIIKIMALAPEIPGAMKLIEELAGKEIVPAIGHSSASAEIVRKAVKHGLRHITHLGNNGEGDISCVNSCYRHDGPLLEMLNNTQLTAEIIADGIHVSPEFARLLFRAKGAGNCAAITDGCAASGLEDEEMVFPDPSGKLEKFTVKNDALYIAGTDQLTGSLLTMDKAFMNLMKFAGLSFDEAAKSCGEIPRRIAGIKSNAQILPGVRAEFAIISKDGEVELTMADGKIIYSKKGFINERIYQKTR